jgi:plastocyanin
MLLCLFLSPQGGQATPHPFAVPSAAVVAVTGGHHHLAGTIEGRVTVRERPARRTPSRYAGGAGGSARPVQKIPAVVYLEGRLAGPARPLATEMAQQDTTFSPAVVVVPARTEVTFPNRDPFFHNVFSYSSTQRFDLGRYPRGEAKTVRFDEPGVVKIYCEVHESMRAAVIVTENPFHAVLGPDGTFRLEGVPAGMHRLVVWHVDEGTTSQEVRVPEGGTARVELTIG